MVNLIDSMATLDPPKINAQEKAYVLAALYALPQILTQEVSAPNSAKTSAIEAFLSTLPTLLQQWMCKQRGQLWGDAGCSSNDLCRAVAHLGGQRMLSQSLLHGMRLKELLLQQLNAPRRWIDFHLAPRTATDLLLLPTPSPFSSCLCDQFDFSDCWSSYAPDTSTALDKVPELARQSFSAAAPFAVWIRPGGRPRGGKCLKMLLSVSQHLPSPMQSKNPSRSRWNKGR